VNCDPIARWYRGLEYIGFGKELERRRFALLKELADAHRVLVLGEGDGRFLARLAEQNRGASIDYLDLSARMLELARRRAGSDQITYHQGDALTFPLPVGEYDLVVTNFFLDCFKESDAAKVVDRVAAAARPGARWLIAEFRQPERGWQAVWASAWLRMLYLFFRVTTGLETRQLVDHHSLLRKHSFRIERAEAAFFGLLASELWIRP
jgi:ubiquinone/menaquinone biosynthesis C-methylase UbiE